MIRSRGAPSRAPFMSLTNQAAQGKTKTNASELQQVFRSSRHELSPSKSRHYNTPAPAPAPSSRWKSKARTTALLDPSDLTEQLTRLVCLSMRNARFCTFDFTPPPPTHAHARTRTDRHPQIHFPHPTTFARNNILILIHTHRTPFTVYTSDGCN